MPESETPLTSSTAPTCTAPLPPVPRLAQRILPDPSDLDETRATDRRDASEAARHCPPRNCHPLRLVETREKDRLSMDKKRRHHYVWRRYLEAWETDGRVWTRIGSGRPKPINPVGLAVETDYYRLRPLSPDDVALLDALVLRNLRPDLRDMAEAWVSALAMLHGAYLEYEAGRMAPDEKKAFDIALNNVIEDLYAQIEGPMNPVLDALRVGNAAVLDDSNRLFDFATFLASQYFRTLSMAKAVTPILESIPSDYHHSGAVWGAMRLVFSFNLAASLSSRPGALTPLFLDAPAGAEFATGDQPVINVHTAGVSLQAPTQDLEFLYPLSPQVAILLDATGPRRAASTRRSPNEDEVARYNAMIAAESSRQIYAQSEQVASQLYAGMPLDWRS